MTHCLCKRKSTRDIMPYILKKKSETYNNVNTVVIEINYPREGPTYYSFIVHVPYLVSKSTALTDKH
jgi:hypothetical protein